MSYRQEDRVIIENIKLLIKSLTGFEECDHNFVLCEQYAINTIKNHRFLSVDSHAVKRSMTGLVEKFRIHGHSRASEKLHQLFNSLINQPIFLEHPQYDLKWSLISLLINLSYNPTGALYNKSIDTPAISVSIPQTDYSPVDWKKVLSEGIDLRDNYDSDSLSSWSESEAEFVEPAQEVPINSISNLTLCANNSSKQELNDSKSSSEDFENNDSIQGSEWLPEEPLQPVWWEFGTSFDAKSKFSAANLAKDWNEYLKELTYGIIETDNPFFISEYCVIRELIWLMVAPQTPNRCRIFYRDDDNKFQIRKNITIPSLTPTTFQNLLSTWCSKLTILYEFDYFLESAISIEDKRAPFTYKAYRECAIKILEPFKTHLAELEEHVRLQDDIFTLLTLQADLKPYFKKLQLLYNIHKDCILDWQNTPANVCVANLLTKLYNKCFTQDSETANLSFILFVSSLKVYLNIITLWLNGGRLEDWRNEFSIESKQEPDTDLQEFSLRDYPAEFDINKHNPFLKTLLIKVLYAGQSIHILQRLDRVRDILKQVQLKDNLHTLFKKAIMSEILQYEVKFRDETPNVHSTDITTCENNNEGKLKFVPQIEDAFLRAVFHKITSKPKSVQVHNNQDIDMLYLYERLSSIPQIPLKTVLDKVLNEILNNNCMQACKVVVDILKDDFQLQKHLDALQNIMLMHSSGPMYNFYIHLFREMETGNQWNSPYYLTSQLEAYLAYSTFSNLGHFFSLEMQKPVKSINTNLNCLECLTMSYTVQYPLSIVITKDNLQKYQSCMQFLLKVNWGHWALQNLKFSNELRKRLNYTHAAEVTSRKLQMLRFWLLHAVGSIHSYLFGQVLNTAKINLRKKIDSAVAHEDLIVAHKEFIDDVYEHCLLVPKHKSIQKVIIQLLKLVQMVRSEWIDRFESKQDVTDGILNNDMNDWDQICTMESIYSKCHSYLQETFKSNYSQGRNDKYSELYQLDKYCFVYLGLGIIPPPLRTVRSMLIENSVFNRKIPKYKRNFLLYEYTPQSDGSEVSEDSSIDSSCAEDLRIHILQANELLSEKDNSQKSYCSIC